MLAKLLHFKRTTPRNEPETEEINTGDFSFLGTDIHSHIIPGIDDGPKTFEESVSLVKGLKELGFTILITTPHIRSDHYPNTKESIRNGVEQLSNALIANNIDLQIKAAAEYYVDNHFIHLLDTEPLLTIHENKVLIEFSFLFEPSKITDIIFRIQTAGYIPVIAHPERYLYYHKNIDRYKLFKDRGCMLQLNLISLSGYYGRNIKVVAETLLKNKLYDYCGSDAHHLKHVDSLKDMLKRQSIRELYRYPFLNPTISA